MQFAADHCISVQRIPKLLLPEVFACLWHGREFAAEVAMPKAAIDEDRCVKSPQPEVGATNNFGAVQGVSIAEAVKCRSEHELWFRIFAPDATHHPRTSRLINDVCHLAPGLIAQSWY